MSNTSEINQSPHGWWIAVLVESFQFYDEELKGLDELNSCDEKFVLIEAFDREEAYNKAIEIGESFDSIEGVDPESQRKGRWGFKGITSLLPIYERFEDGSEVFCRSLDYFSASVKSVDDIVCAKEELECFEGKEDT